jgi:predicted TIM-barrel fold metal-dependent hydrolase
MLGSDEMLLFSTDYPHWDFDSPERALPPIIPGVLREKILWSNAQMFYGLPERNPPSN